MTEPTVYDHYRATAGDDEGELFRVVGVDDGRVTLLRLTEDGERTGTGDLRHVDRTELESAFELGANPDPRFSTLDYVAGLFVVGGVGLLAASPDDPIGGAVLAGTGLYLLWRRHG